jgi:hypothetical protein
LASGGRPHANPRGTWLRNRSISSRSWRKPGTRGTIHARFPHQPHLRGFQRNHAPVSGPGSSGSTPSACRTRHGFAPFRWQATTRGSQGRSPLRWMVPESTPPPPVRRTIGNPDGIEILSRIRRENLAKACPNALPCHGPSRSRTGKTPIATWPARGRSRRTLHAHCSPPTGGVILRHEAESASTDRSEIPAVLSFLDKRTKCRVNRLFRELHDNPDDKARTLSRKILDFPS